MYKSIVRGVEERTAGSAVGAWRSSGGGQERQPVCKTHKLKDSKGRDFNERYKEILDHYGLKATRTNSYSAHENGVAEQGHRRLKDS